MIWMSRHGLGIMALGTVTQEGCSMATNLLRKELRIFLNPVGKLLELNGQEHSKFLEVIPGLLLVCDGAHTGPVRWWGLDKQDVVTSRASIVVLCTRVEMLYQAGGSEDMLTLLCACWYMRLVERLVAYGALLNLEIVGDKVCLAGW